MTDLDQTSVENDWEDPKETALRAQLGVRPRFYSRSAEKGTHPDTRPCPSWCWVGQDDKYDHEVNPSHPLVATHTPAFHSSVVATLYAGEVVDDDVMQMATIEPQLEQSVPRIYVRLRHYPGGEQDFRERLCLTLTDARELVTALNYLIEAAEGGSATS